MENPSGSKSESAPKISSQISPELAAIAEVIRRNDWREGERQLHEFLEKSPVSKNPVDRLTAYSHLIRFAAELRSFEKIPNYITEIKKIEIGTPGEKYAFAICLFATGTGWFYSGQIDKARQYYQQALDIALELANEDLVFDCQLQLVDLMRTEGLYDQILPRIEALTVAAEASKNPLSIGRVWTLLGNVYRKQGHYNSAIQAFEKAREIFGKYRSSEAYHYVLWALGTSYAALEDKEKAKIYLELARNASAQGVEFWRINVMSGLTLAELHTISGEFAEAESAYKRVAETVGEDENSYYGRRLLRGMALLAIKQGEFAKATSLIDRLVIVAVRENSTREIMRLRMLKAEVLLREGEAADHDEARAMLQESLAYHKERGMRRHQAVCLELLARLDSRQGFPSDALKKVEDTIALARDGAHDRLALRAELARLVLQRKLGDSPAPERLNSVLTQIDRLHAAPERVIHARFTVPSYDEWTTELARLDSHGQRYVNEFYEDFHFVANQTIDIEIDRNSNYVREKHLGEIPFHNKFTLMRLLCLLAETPGKEYSKEQLANSIWEQDYNPLRHDNNIYININRLRKLIEPNPRESRYVMNGARGYYFNPAMKVNISSKIADVAPRTQSFSRPPLPMRNEDKQL